MAKMKRVLALVLCAVMLLGVMPISGFADGAGAGKVIVYKVYNGDVANAQLVEEIDCNIGDNLYETADKSGVSEAAGYTMDKWFRMDTPGTKYSETGTVGGTHETYVNYVGKECTVTFDANGGKLAEGAESERTVTYGKEYGEFPSVSKTGYTLKGWTLNNEFKQSTDKVYTVGNHKLVAEWDAVQVKAKFDLDGDKVADSGMEPILVTYDQPYGAQLIDPPAQEGKVFKGWTLWEGTPVDGTTPVTKDTDHTLVATWNDRATISFDLNGGTAAEGADLTDRVLEAGDKYDTLPAAPTRIGYKFGYWALNSENGEEVKSDSVVTADAKLVAHWIPETYTLYFEDGNGVKLSSKKITFGEAYGELFTPQAEQNKVFAGWVAKQDNVPVDEDTIVAKYYDHTLIPTWKDQTVTLTFDVADGKPIDDMEVDVKDGKLPALPTPERTGYKFINWTYNGVDVKKGYALPEGVETMELKALWSAKNFSITLNAGEGKFANKATTKSVPVSFGAAYPAMEEPVSNDDTMKFDHWELNGKKVVPGVTEVKTDGNHTLTAVYSNKTVNPADPKPDETAKKVTITLKPKGGKINGKTQTVKTEVTVGSTYQIPEATRAGKTLARWKSSDGKFYAPGSSFEVTGKVTLTAVWEKASSTTSPTQGKTATVTLKTNGGTADGRTTVSVKVGGFYKIPDATKAGFVLTRWTDESGEVYYPGEMIKISENGITLTAFWEPDKEVAEDSKTEGNKTEIVWNYADENGEIFKHGTDYPGDANDTDAISFDCEENQVGKKGLFYVSQIAEKIGAEGAIPKGYVLADGQENYVEITYGRKNLVTFRLKVNPANTIVKWKIQKSNGTVVAEGTDYLTTDAAKRGEAMDYAVKADKIPAGYKLSGESKVSVTQGVKNSVTFNIVPNDYQTITNWSIQNAKGEVLNSGTKVGKKVAEKEVGSKEKFYLKDVASVPAGYELASTQPEYVNIKLGQENDVVFKVSPLPRATIVHYSFVDDRGNEIVPARQTKLPETTKIGEKSSFSCEDAGGLPTYVDMDGDTRTYRLIDAADRSQEIILGQENTVTFKVCKWPETGNTLFDRFMYWLSYTFLFKR